MTHATTPHPIAGAPRADRGSSHECDPRGTGTRYQSLYTTAKNDPVSFRLRAQRDGWSAEVFTRS